MKVFIDLNELIKRLYTERKLLHALFQARLRYDFSYEEAAALVENEKNLRLLIDYGVIRQEGDLIELEETYQHFFEEVLRLNEDITSSSVEENLRSLKENIDFYLKERTHPEAQGKYVRKIMRYLRNISTQASTKAIELKHAINDTFRQERNYEIKRTKLENYLATLDSISSLIRQTERLLEERRETMEVMTPDDRIICLILDVKIQFKDVFHSLIDLERTIRDYLNQIDAHNRLVKHIRKLKYLKDQLTWERTTNVREIIEKCSNLILETTAYYTTKVSLSFLRNSDEAIGIISDARKSISKFNTLKNTPSPPLKESELNAKCIVEDFVDTESLANAFFASSQDLYTFVINYPYAQPQQKERKVEYYLEIVQNHYSKLHITDDWRRDGNVEYPLIYNLP
ncbi:MAG: hypothetical protein K2K64_01730 [Muribaculaceae bacterium]|nr:hypothetical protein [Muribaculaceae bacterium]